MNTPRPEKSGSLFWQQLRKSALSELVQPFNPNRLATFLGCSQGKTHRWFTGGYPEIPLLIRLAKLGKTTVDSLLTGEPRYVSDDPAITELVTIAESLSDEARDRILHVARLEAMAAKADTEEADQPVRKSASRSGNKRA